MTSPYPPSFKDPLPENSQVGFWLALPLMGLWVFLFLRPKTRKREDVQRVFILHCLILGYFVSSHLFLSFSFWLVPYFIEPVISILTQINMVIVSISFSLMAVWAIWNPQQIWTWFDGNKTLVLIWDWFFSSSKS